MMDEGEQPSYSRDEYEASTPLASTTVTPSGSSELWPSAQFGALFGPSVQMRELFLILARVAASSASALIEGETGTGKELAARAIHESSERREGPFVIIDCGALQDNLLEAELFGHAKGAFTGAASARAGALESAAGGSVFLDEIGELPLSMQPKLLRALESRTVRRLGENRHRPIDVRFISATHRNLLSMVHCRSFREDLYFRLAAVPVRIPPLREREGDVAALARHFLDASKRTLTPVLLRSLVQRSWPGNVRELRNFLECASVLGIGEALAFYQEQAAPLGQVEWKPPLCRAMLQLPFKEMVTEVVAQAERSYVEELLLHHGGHVSRAAEAARIHRSYLHRLMSRYGL